MRQTIEAERSEPSAEDHETAPAAAGLAEQQVAAAPEAGSEAAGAGGVPAERNAATEPVDVAPALEPLDEPALPNLVEALLFVSDGPVEESRLARALDVTARQVRDALDTLAVTLDGRGVRLQRGPEGAQLVTAPGTGPHIEAFMGLEASRKLSPAALETLAIIAYRQPVTRATIESVRGVNSDGSIATLRARDLIEEVGRAPGPGRPRLFASTQRFLRYFGLAGAQDLPALGDHDLPEPDAPQPMFDGDPAADEGAAITSVAALDEGQGDGEEPPAEPF